MFSLAEIFLGFVTELPDFLKQNRPKDFQKGHEIDFFLEKRTSGNSELTGLVKHE